MTDIFENSANFNGISDVKMKVSKVIQKAFIEVNEIGTEAAAVSGKINLKFFFFFNFLTVFNLLIFFL